MEYQNKIFTIFIIIAVVVIAAAMAMVYFWGLPALEQEINQNFENSRAPFFCEGYKDFFINEYNNDIGVYIYQYSCPKENQPAASFDLLKKTFSDFEVAEQTENLLIMRKNDREYYQDGFLEKHFQYIDDMGAFVVMEGDFDSVDDLEYYPIALQYFHNAVND